VRKAVVLLSGGIDSTTTLAIAADSGFEPHALTFRYGQRHETEIGAARRVAKHFGVKQHIIVLIDLRVFGDSALTSSVPVPKGRSMEEIGTGIPATYVPARNTIFLSFALAWAEVLQCDEIFIGVNALDYSGYPDCRPEFVAAFQAMANLATKAAVEKRQLISIRTPLIDLSKAEIIKKGLALGVNYALTTSCYDPDPRSGAACGECDACLLRLKGFAENDMDDPSPYRKALVSHGI
jgi:7-cyano-7-deazaguanine synthase